MTRQSTITVIGFFSTTSRAKKAVLDDIHNYFDDRDHVSSSKSNDDRNHDGADVEDNSPKRRDSFAWLQAPSAATTLDWRSSVQRQSCHLRRLDTSDPTE